MNHFFSYVYKNIKTFVHKVYITLKTFYIKTFLHKDIFCRYKICPSIRENKLDVKTKHVAVLHLIRLNIPELMIIEINNNLCKIY